MAVILIAGLAYLLVVGFNVALVFMPVWFLRSRKRTPQNEIETVETIRFQSAYFPNGFRSGFNYGSIIGFVFGLAGVLIGGLTYGPIGILVGGLAGGLAGVLAGGFAFGLIAGLASSFQPALRSLKTSPNEGIWLSLRNASLMGGVGGLVLGVIVGIFSEWTAGLAYGALGSLCIGLWYGGLDVIQHFLVRFLLWRAGSLPWRLAPFLDYAAEELNFLQKVGGGYIFVHRYLLEHFAAMDGSDSGSPQESSTFQESV